MTTEIAAAGAWMQGEVAPSAAVACDPTTCAALRNSGFVGNEVRIGSGSTSLSNASLVVVTPALRTRFKTNSGLGADVAQVDLANYGAVTIQFVDPSGGAAYQTALNQAVTKRTNVGRALANSGKVSGDTSDLAAGRADPRLMLIIKALAAKEQVDVVTFTDSGPGASPGVPFRQMSLATTDPLGKIAAAVYLKVIVTLLQAHATFPPPHISKGSTSIQIWYPAPSPN